MTTLTVSGFNAHMAAIAEESADISGLGAWLRTASAYIEAASPRGVLPVSVAADHLSTDDVLEFLSLAGEV